MRNTHYDHLGRDRTHQWVIDQVASCIYDLVAYDGAYGPPEYQGDQGLAVLRDLNAKGWGFDGRPPWEEFSDSNGYIRYRGVVLSDADLLEAVHRAQAWATGGLCGRHWAALAQPLA